MTEKRFETGTGFLSLELAREGHDVTGLDSDEKMVSLAQRARDTDPYRSERGKLEYHLADFARWEGQKEPFDLALVSRVFHHIPEPEKNLAKVRGLLRPGGRIVCVEFAYDQFDHRSATWVCQNLKTLDHSGWYTGEKISENVEAGVRQILNEWFEEYEKKENLNKLEALRKPLYRLFREEHFS